MPSRWIDNVLSLREEKRKLLEQERRFMGVAESVSSGKFRRLCEVISQDITAYRSRANDETVTIESKLNDGTFAVLRTSFPTIELRLAYTYPNQITWMTRVKQASSLGEETDSGEGMLVCKGQDDCYFRILGKEFSNEEDVASALLEPLFKRIP